jgi:hypothetical protein
MNNDDLVKQAVASAILDIPEGTLAQWRYLGRGPAYYRVGGHIRYSRADLMVYLESVKVQPTSAA